MMQSLVEFKNKKKGFTLVELIVVIAIIGILASILMPKFMGFTDDARKKATIAEAKTIRTLAESYYASNGAWPVVVSGTAATGTATDAVTGVKNFKVQTEKVTPATANNSPSFGGIISIGTATQINNGAFQYEKNGFTAVFDAGGTITGSATQ